MPREQQRQINTVLNSCGQCPFHQLIEQDLEVRGYMPLQAGHYCLKLEKMGERPGLLVSVAYLEYADQTFHGWCRSVNGSPFPERCPLPVLQPVAQPSGKRNLDV